MSLPILNTSRLALRQFCLTDKFDVQQLADNPNVSDNTLSIPYPYTLEMAEEWINTVSAADRNDGVTYAITLNDTEQLLGGISLKKVDQGIMELGYWLGEPYWGCGYCTEAAAAIITFSFDQLGTQKIEADHLISNPASGKVMQKNAMRWVRNFKQVHRDGKLNDFARYEIVSTLKN